jgi:hypothetical protein
MKFYEKNGYRGSAKIADFFGMPLREYVKPRPLNLILTLVERDSSLKAATNSPTHAAIPIRRIKSCCSALLSAPIVNASRSPNDNAYFRASS